MTGRTASTGSGPELNQTADATESVPGYRDLARIGHGGFSVVYRAVQESFERAVALKVLNVGPDEDARRRFVREVRLAGRLSGHPHVVTVLDTGTTASGRPYLAMDLYEGGSMRDRLRRRGPLSAAETASAGAKIAEALAAAHSFGVLHRDVKPNNILISRFGEPALADFGVSCLLDSSSSASVLDVFSPQHAAPELMTRGVLTASSDIYALGSTLYQLLTGRPPFGGEERDVRSIMWRAVSEPPPRPDCPELPELADAIVRAMAKDPQERFPDAAEFARTLRALTPDAATGLAAQSFAVLSSSMSSASAIGATAADATFDRERISGEFGFEPDTSSVGRLRSRDETMVRPDRSDSGDRPAAAAKGRDSRDGRDGRDGRSADDRDASRSRRVRKPLVLVAAIGLFGAAVLAVLASQDFSTGSRATGSAQHPLVSASPAPTRSGGRPTMTAKPTPKRSTAPAAQSAATTSTGVHPSVTASASSGAGGSLLSLPGTFQRLQNAQTGNCLAQPAGGSSIAQQSCAADKSQGWQYSLSISGILAAGDYELVNEQSGQCLTASSGGQVVAQACGGSQEQLWSKVAGSGSGKEFQNAGDGQCLLVSHGVVSYGSCGASDRADLWNEDGTA